MIATETKRVIVTRSIMPPETWGLYALVYMQVCAESDATNEEILAACNTKNPAGTENGWTTVVRNDEENPKMNPVACNDMPGRTHFLVSC